MITTTIGELRVTLKEALGSGLSGAGVVGTASSGELVIRDHRGKKYLINRDALNTSLIMFGATKDQRQSMLDGGDIPDAAVKFLLKRGVLKSAPAAEKQPAPQASAPKQISFSQAQLQYRSAAKKFARNWTHFTKEMPDVQPEDAAVDAAEGFFYEYPWQKWASAMSMSRAEMKDAIADYVHDAMTRGQ